MTTPHSTPLRVPVTADVTLSGHLTLPREPIRGSVVLVSGSGPQDRYESIAGVQPFAVLHERLSDAGFVVASWDDRGVGGSEGDYLASNGAELVSDVSAVLDVVDGLLPGGPRFLAGHSQGALVATEVAAQRSSLTGLILIAGAFRPGRDVLVSQHRRICDAEGWTNEETESSLAFKEACFSVLEQFPSDASEEQLRVMRARLGDVAGEWGLDPATATELIDDLMEWEWRYLLRHSSDTTLPGIACPVLLVAGDRDTQIGPDIELEAAKVLLQGGRCPAVTAVLVPDANHLLQETTDGSPSAYRTLGTPFTDRSVGPIVAWLRAQA